MEQPTASTSQQTSVITTVPGDKSITHRALFFGALNQGVTSIQNPSPAADCRSTLQLLRTLGYHIEEHNNGWKMDGSRRSSHPDMLTLDCGNSGTTARLAAGFLTGERGTFTLVGDESLMRRPMERVAEPLRTLGASVATTNGTMPVRITGASGITGKANEAIETHSAQIHAALVLAALRSAEGVTIRRTKQMRDHTLRICELFGIRVDTDNMTDIILPGAIDTDVVVDVPGDVSSAAFMVAAALLVPGARIDLHGIGLNPTRIAFLNALRAMGAQVTWDIASGGYEPIGNLHAEYSPAMRGIELDSSGKISVAEMMDELPLLSLIGARATGTTVVRGASELRVKESDRISATVEIMRSMGVEMKEHEDGFEVQGPQRIAGGCTVNHYGDHRLCMLAAVANLIAGHPITIPDPDVVSVSYPGFHQELHRLFR